MSEAISLLENLPYGYHLWKSSGMENDLGDWICAKFSEPEFEYDNEFFIQGKTPEEAINKMLELIKNKEK